MIKACFFYPVHITACHQDFIIFLDNTTCCIVNGFNAPLAILHDFDASVLGRDISHVVKYNSYNGKEIREVLNNFVDFELREMKLDFINNDIDLEVKTFVKLCDWLSMLTFIIRNKRMGVTDFNNEEKYCLEKTSESVNVVKFMIEDKFSDYELDLQFFNNLITDVYGD